MKVEIDKKAMFELENFPNVSNIKRVGDYRILFDIEEDILTIYEIKHRKKAYD
jgi:hypothetical protein